MDWPHAPAHRLPHAGAYMVTAGTYGKQHFFRESERRSMLTQSLLDIAAQRGWSMQAWAVFSNHYHFIAFSPGDPNDLRLLVSQLHTVTAKAMNEMDGMPSRKVWFQYWDTLLTYERSFLARLKYVHDNAVRHGLARVATDYPWCSAGWFEQTASRSFYNVVQSLKTDRVNVRDDFVPK